MQSASPEEKFVDPGVNQAARGRRVSTGKLNDWQRLFLGRLDYLLTKQSELLQESEPDQEQKRLLSKAIYSTFLDCQDQGLAGEALQLIAQRTQPEHSSN